MGVDFYLHWDGQTEEESAAQITGFATVGDRGYIREAYGHSVLATEAFCPESFSDGREVYLAADEARRDALAAEGELALTVDELAARLPATRAAVRRRANGQDDYADDHYKAFVDFVALARRLVDEGKRVWIYNSY